MCERQHGNGGNISILLHASPSLIHGKSRMRRRARTDLCGGRSVMAVPTATAILPVPVRKSAGQKLMSEATEVLLRDIIGTFGRFLRDVGLARSRAAPVEDLHYLQAGKVFLSGSSWWQALTRPSFRNAPSPGLSPRSFPVAP